MYKCILLIFLLVCFFVATLVNAEEFVKDGLIAMWTLDKASIQGETVKDVSGNGKDATMKGVIKSIAGVIGECLQFEGKAETYVEIPKMGTFAQVSVECWAMEDQFSGIQGIVSTWQWEEGKVHFKFESNQIQVDKNGGGKIVFAAELSKWYHIVYTTDTKTSLHRLYVDGKLGAEGPGGAAAEKWDERRMGSEHDGRWLIGKIDEVRVYNRVLTEKEITNNFNVKSNKIAVDPSGKSATCWGVLKHYE
ncbi:MAG: LamG protein [Candidatus Poribacteria bacterium]|nr:LamG protein [Candidatus Poribacteria bacterium]